MVLCAQSSPGYPIECLAYYFELLCECPFHKQTAPQKLGKKLLGCSSLDSLFYYVITLAPNHTEWYVYRVKDLTSGCYVNQGVFYIKVFRGMAISRETIVRQKEPFVCI